MSDALRIAMVVEGPTDFVVLDAAISALLPGRQVVLQCLQPEFSAAFEVRPNEAGLGWSGVYRWCLQAQAEGQGRVSGASLFTFFDVLVIQVDADVAGMTYGGGHIDDPEDDLPCEQPCPPPRNTKDALRRVILRWMGENEVPERCVLCTPSKSTEAWVLVAIFPNSREVAKKGWECHANPESQLGQQPKAVRIRKDKTDYQSKRNDIIQAWPRVQERLTEAKRFSTELVKEIETLPQ